MKSAKIRIISLVVLVVILFEVIPGSLFTIDYNEQVSADSGGRKGHPAIRSGETPVRVENAWAAIIDSETFQIVQKKMAAKSPKVIHPRRVSSTFLLSGILFCSCGRAMIGCSAKSGHTSTMFAQEVSSKVKRPAVQVCCPKKNWRVWSSDNSNPESSLRRIWNCL